MAHRAAYRPVSGKPSWAKVSIENGRILSRHATKTEALQGIPCLCSHHRPSKARSFILNARLDRADPTRTTPIVRRFLKEFRRRVRALQRQITNFIATEDELALGERTNLSLVGLRRQYEFRTDADKVTAFRQWLQTQIDGGFLSVSPGQDPTRPWDAEFIESAYRRGQINAYLSARQGSFTTDFETAFGNQVEFISSSFAAPETLAKIQFLGTRAFEELRGFTGGMATELNRILARGIADGIGPRELAREMVRKMGGVTQKRAETIARTEIINAHAEGQLDAFDKLGIDELGIKSEFSTAGDDRVCPECSAMEGQLFTTEEARGVIPVHPNCRCTWIPAAQDDKKK